jgi:hypothetical protein
MPDGADALVRDTFGSVQAKRGRPSVAPLGLTSSEMCALLLLMTVYLRSRLYAVSHLPVFSDEALQIHWHWARESLSHGGGGLSEGTWLTIKLFALLCLPRRGTESAPRAITS